MPQILLDSPQPTDRVGLILAGVSALGLGLAIAVARFAYEGGANGLTVATGRSLLFVPALYLFCRLTGRNLRIPARQRYHAAGLGLLMAGAFYGNVGAVQYIPVGLAAILFFTFPPLIALVQTIVTRKLPSLAGLVALATAFAGLVLMLGVSFGEANPLGIALALGAGLCVALNAVWLQHKVAHVDSVVLTFYMGCTAVVVLVAIIIATDGIQLPQTPGGWLGMVSVAALQTVSLPLFYMSISRVGPLKAGMVANIQPIVSIVAAYLFFAEVLSALQFAGGALVLGGIWLMQRGNR